jgi:hypothetical protein
MAAQRRLFGSEAAASQPDRPQKTMACPQKQQSRNQTLLSELSAASDQGQPKDSFAGLLTASGRKWGCKP